DRSASAPIRHRLAPQLQVVWRMEQLRNSYRQCHLKNFYKRLASTSPSLHCLKVHIHSLDIPLARTRRTLGTEPLRRPVSANWIVAARSQLPPGELLSYRG